MDLENHGSKYAPEEIKEIALKLKGIPYKHNGRSEDGVDCWGLVLLFFSYLGIDLPYGEDEHIPKNWYKIDPGFYLKELKQVGKEVGSYENLLPLDIPYFRLYKDVVTHTSVMLDKSYFIHVLINKEVSIDTMEKRYWRKKYEGARRLKNIYFSQESL
ncbi:MAG: C40 family peptidase [Bacillota bacterium]